MLGPRLLARLIGLTDDPRRRLILRLIGCRELAVGVGIFSGRGRSAWLWARVAGDTMDLVLLAVEAGSPGKARRRAPLVFGAIAAAAVVDVVASVRSHRESSCRAQELHEGRHGHSGDIHGELLRNDPGKTCCAAHM